MNKLKVLAACEESQRVCIAFRERGFEAYSCDIQMPSGEHPEWHILGDVLPVLRGGQIVTMDNQIHNIDKWDLIIAFPPCTHLAVSGAAHFEKKRIDGRQRKGIEFFCQFLNLNCKHVCIENPVNIISGNYITQYFPDLCQKYNLPIKASQTVSPHWFGSTTRKKTNYWLKGLPELKATNIVEPKLKTYIYADGTKKTFSEDFCVGTGKDRGKARSKTDIGIAEAMADQWGKYLLEEETDNESS